MIDKNRPVARIVSGYSGDPDTRNDLDIRPIDLTGLRPGDLLYARREERRLIEWTEDEDCFSILCSLVEGEWVPDMETLETSATYPTAGSAAWLHIKEKANKLAAAGEESE